MMTTSYQRRKFEVTQIDVDVFAIEESGQEVASGIPDRFTAFLFAGSSEMYDALKDIADNWDHDEDGHRYGTGCRCCKAQDVIDKINREANRD